MYNLRNTWLSVFLIAAATLFFAGCEKGSQGLGAEVLPPGDIIGFTFTDTTSIFIETVQEDNINTFNETDLLFGNYVDPEFGHIRAKLYTEFIARSELNFGDPADVVLDSVVLGFGIRDSYGRLDQFQTLEVFELDEDVPEDEAASTDKELKVKGPNLAQNFSFRYDSAGAMRIIRARLNDSFGQKFLDAGDALESTTSFREFFKGIAIGTQDAEFTIREPGAIFTVGIDEAAPTVVIYYRKNVNGALTVQEPEPFLVTGSTPRFTGISRDDSDDKLLGLATSDPDIKNQFQLIQAGAFIKNYLKFPHIDKMPIAAISRAQLILSVDTSLFGSKGSFIPPALIAPLLAGPDGTEVLNERGSPIDLEFNLSAVAPYDASTGTYSFDLTGYVQRVVSKQEENNGMILYPSAVNFSVNRAVFGGALHPTLKPVLRLTYTSLPE